MVILLYIALGYLLLTTGILFLNRLSFRPLLPSPGSIPCGAPGVSICIPARNEAKSIERCIRSAVEQKYLHSHVYVLDDLSTDGTSQILNSLSALFPDKLTVVDGKAKPDDWLGKPWACHQLSQVASGEALIFIDADTWLEPEAVGKVIRTMEQHRVDFLTVWPRQKLVSFWEKMIIPLVYFALLTLLPARYVRSAPKWLPAFLRKKTAALFSAACGQFMAFKRNAYHTIGGHASVKDQIVEDVELARKIKRAGYAMNMYHGKRTVTCRMYSSASELWEGFRKNFFAGFSHSYFLFVGAALLHVLAFIFPIISLPFIFYYGTQTMLVLCLGTIVLMLSQRFALDIWFDWNPLYGLLHPVAICWFQALGVQVLFDQVGKVPVHWKERQL